MIVKTRAIILHAMKYGENGRILKAMTSEEGLVPIFIRSAGSAKKGRINAYLEPMTRVELCYTRRNGTGMADLREITPLKSAELMETDVLKSSIAMFMAEVGRGIVHEEEKDQPLFELLWTWVEKLHNSKKKGDIPLLYLISLSNILGFGPDLESEGLFFDLREGLFISSPPDHVDYLEENETALFRAFLLYEAGNGSRPVLKKNDSKQRLLLQLLYYFKLHLHGFRDIKSHEILAQVLS